MLDRASRALRRMPLFPVNPRRTRFNMLILKGDIDFVVRAGLSPKIIWAEQNYKIVTLNDKYIVCVVGGESSSSVFLNFFKESRHRFPIEKPNRVRIVFRIHLIKGVSMNLIRINIIMLQ